MSDYEFDRFEITEDTEFVVEPGSLTIEESEWLRANGAVRVRGHSTNSGKVTKLEIDVNKLSQLAFEYDLLKQVASTVEIEILETFRNSADRTLTTGEIADETGRPKSSISRALTRLVEKGKLDKVQAGVYRQY